MGAGKANTPRATVAMITHEVPGDSFWDLIRKGAQAAADKDNIELRYSNDPEAPNQANLVQSAIDSRVNGIALTLAKPDAMAPGGQGRAGRGHSGRRVQLRASTTSRRWACRSISARTRSSPGSRPGERLNKDGAKKVDLRHPGAGSGRAGIPMRRCHGGLQGAVRDPERQQQGHAVGGVDDHRQAAAGSSPSTTWSRWARRSRWPRCSR